MKNHLFIKLINFHNIHSIKIRDNKMEGESDQNQKKVIRVANLPAGVHLLDDNEEVHGFKYYKDCEAVQTWYELLRGVKTTFSFCFSPKAIAKKTVVRPRCGGYSDDLRTEKLNVGKIVTPCGRECKSAKAPFYTMEYRANETKDSALDTRFDRVCEEGIHFWARLDALKFDAGIRAFYYSSTTRDRNGVAIETTDYELDRDWNLKKTVTRKYNKKKTETKKYHDSGLIEKTTEYMRKINS